MSGTGTAVVIDGKAVAESVIDEVAAAAAGFRERFRAPRLAVILAGDDPASQIYVRNKIVAAGRCGIESTLIEMPASASAETIGDRVRRLNEDAGVDGILVQLPLPQQIDEHRLIELIAPEKDVDGIHPENLGRLASGRPRFIPCTPAGIAELLSRHGIETAGKRAVVIGRSLIVGRPMGLLLSRKGPGGDATVTICHSRTADLGEATRGAEILIAAIGSPRIITGDMVREGAAVIDVGTNRIADPGSPKGYRLVGDVDFEAVRAKASFITPVPGGVGPMTIAMLMRNTLLAAKLARGAGNEE